jgi:putative endonuclease
MGEIDIIAKNGDFLCFIEVKARSSTYFGMPSQAVNRKKQMTIRKIALIYMKSNFLMNSAIRFDIVEIIYEKSHQDQVLATNTSDTNNDIIIKDINILKNAF